MAPLESGVYSAAPEDNRDPRPRGPHGRRVVADRVVKYLFGRDGAALSGDGTDRTLACGVGSRLVTMTSSPRVAHWPSLRLARLYRVLLALPANAGLSGSGIAPSLGLHPGRPLVFAKRPQGRARDARQGCRAPELLGGEVARHRRRSYPFSGASQPVFAGEFGTPRMPMSWVWI